MVLGLTKQEFDIAKDLTHIALANAAASFSKMTRKTISFTEIKVNPTRFKFSKGKKTDDLYIMTTEYLGDVLADTFLVMTAENSVKLAEIMFPSPKLNDTLKEAILLETDNILAAAVATKYSDILKHDVTGDVPQLSKRSLTNTEEFINSKLEHDHTHFAFITHFKSSGGGLDAHFICAFRDSFKHAIESIDSSSPSLSVIQKEMKNAKQYLR